MKLYQVDATWDSPKWTDGIYSRRLTTRWTYGGQRLDKKGLPELDAETEVGEVPDFRQR